MGCSGFEIDRYPFVCGVCEICEKRSEFCALRVTNYFEIRECNRFFGDVDKILILSGKLNMKLLNSRDIYRYIYCISLNNTAELADVINTVFQGQFIAHILCEMP